MTTRKRTMAELEKAGWVEDLRPASLPDTLMAFEMFCEACGDQGLMAILLRNESGQRVTFAQCLECGHTDELVDIQRARLLGRCPRCNAIRTLDVLTDRVRCPFDEIHSEPMERVR